MLVWVPLAHADEAAPLHAGGAVRLKHKDMVIGALFAPDGKTVFTAGWDKAVRQWDARTGKEARVFTGHADAVFGIALSADGRWLASGSADKTIRLWDTSGAADTRVFEGHEAGVTRLAFTPDGKTLVSSSYDRTLRVWDVASGTERRRFGGQEKGFTSFALSPDGATIATGAADHSLRLLDLARGEEIRRCAGHRQSVVGVAYSPDGRCIATASEDNGVHLWNTSTGKQIRALHGHDNGAWAVAFSPDGRLLASGGRDKRVCVWEVASGGLLCRGADHADGVPALDFSPDGRRLLSGSQDTMAVVWDWEGPRPMARTSAGLLAAPTESLWFDLASTDAVRARQALRRLSALPDQALPLVRTHLRPVEKIDAARLDQLLADLDADRFAVRQRATAELRALGEAVELPLRRHLQGTVAPDARQRIGRLLEALEGDLSAEQLRLVRAIELLERLDNAEARSLLTKLSQGAAGTHITEEARFVLARRARTEAAKR